MGLFGKKEKNKSIGEFSTINLNQIDKKQLLENSNIPKIELNIKKDEYSMFLDFCNVRKIFGLGYEFIISDVSISDGNFENEKTHPVKIFVKEKEDAIKYALGYVFYSLGYTYKDKIKVEDITTYASGENSSYFNFSVNINGEYSSVAFEYYSKGLGGYIDRKYTGRRITEATSNSDVKCLELNGSTGKYELAAEYVSDEINDFGFKRKETNEIYNYEVFNGSKYASVNLIHLFHNSEQIEKNFNKEEIEKILQDFCSGKIPKDVLIAYFTRLYFNLKHNFQPESPVILELCICPVAIIVPNSVSIFNATLTNRYIIRYDKEVKVNNAVVANLEQSYDSDDITKRLILHIYS